MITICIAIPDWVTTVLFWWALIVGGGVVVGVPAFALFLKSQRML